MYDLAHVLHMDVPAFAGRMFCQELDDPAVGARTSRPRVRASNGSDAPSQMGTHLDALNHLHIGRPHLQRSPGRRHRRGPTAPTRLGVDTLPQIVTRGLLVDVAGAARRRPPRRR